MSAPFPPQHDLFAQPPARPQVVFPAQEANRRRAHRLIQDAARASHSDEIRRLEPVAVSVGARKMESGFTAADVRDEAERLGILTGHEGRPNAGTDRMEKPRALAYMGALLPGLARIGFVVKVTDPSGRTVYETSKRDRANGNKQALWRVTERGRNACFVAGSSLPQLAEIIEAYRASGVRALDDSSADRAALPNNSVVSSPSHQG